jgi:sulfite reductase (NADPH) hemoprotein beta-component
MGDDNKFKVEGKLSDNERLKGQSSLLRGTISDDLTDDVTGGFTADNFQLIRFHGMYQQDDRDIRAERMKQKLEPLHNVMLRARLPGGVIQPHQWLVIDKFAADYTMYGSIRLTTRQTFQFHGVLKPNMKLMHQTLHKAGIDSIATAGDVNRNVLCTSNPIESRVHKQAWDWATKISEHLLPKTNAYAEIWLNGEKVESTQEDEPILGKNYLPRKFKTTVVIPPQNDVDVHANDLNFVAIAQDGELIGFNVLVGGGLAMTHGDQTTFPRKADDFGFISLDKTLAVAEAVLSTQRDWGNRVNRKNAKTKYTLERVGVENFKAEVESRADVKFGPSRAYEFTSRGDRFGWVEGIDGKHHLSQRKDSMACVSLPTCPLAMAEAERYLPAAVTEIEGLLAKHDMQDESIIYRVTGCPNGCGRSMLAEVGLIGKGPGKYNFYIGGDRQGTRIPRMYKENITDTEIMGHLDELIGRWSTERNTFESFGDYVIRAGIIAPVLDSPRDFYE